MATHDLTRSVEDGMPTYPGDPAVRVESHATHERDGYRVSEVRLGSHAGTHVDAPAHTEPGGRTLGDFPVEAFSFDARLVDCRDLGARAPVSADRVEDVLAGGRARRGSEGASAGGGRPRDGVDTNARDERAQDGDPDALVFDTGWADRWGTDRMVDHPYLTRDAAVRCAERGLHVATDALSVDPTPSPRATEDEPGGVPAHHALLGADRLVIENLTNLGNVSGRFELRAYPLALDADGAPVRAVARV
jgi:kynurenine formamidase